jgi:hypothetical protein
MGFTTNMVVSRDEGATWTSKPPPPEIAVWSVAYGGGLFVAVGQGQNGLGLPNISTSADGTNWSVRDSGTTETLSDIVFANGIFVAAATGNQLLTSPNGVNWVRHTLGPDDEPGFLAFGNGTSVAVGNRGTLLSSVDATNWIAQRTGPAAQLENATYGNGKFVAVGAPLDSAALNAPAVVTSSDGMTWTVPETFSFLKTGQEIYKPERERSRGP